MNKSITYASQLQDIRNINSSFDTGVIRIAYEGKNRNGTYISKESFEDAIPSLYNCPIVCNYDRETDTLGGHDIILHKKDDVYRVINATTPVGVVPESAEYWWDDVEEDDGSTREYLHINILLWKRQEAYQKIVNDGITAQSMEIKIFESEPDDDGLLHINRFEFNALALIGVDPCFESAALELDTDDFEYSLYDLKNDLKKEMQKMLKDLKDANTEVLTSNEDKDKEFAKGGKSTMNFNENDLKDVNEEELENENLEKEAESVEENGVVEEVNEELQEQADDEPVEPKQEDQELDNDEQSEERQDDYASNFSLVSSIRDNLSLQLREHYAPEEDTDTFVIDVDLEKSEVYFEVYSCDEVCRCRLLGAKIEPDGSYYKIDFSTILEYERAFTPVVKENDEEGVEPVETEIVIDEASEQIELLNSELEELRAYKAENESKLAEEARQQILSNFEDLSNEPDFINLVNNRENMSIEELEEKCFALRGRVLSSAQFSNQNKTAKIKVSARTDAPKEPYGGIFAIYGK